MDCDGRLRFHMIVAWLVRDGGDKCSRGWNSGGIKDENQNDGNMDA